MSTNKSTESPMIKAVTREGKRIRVKATAGGTSICYKAQGKWSTDETCTIPLSELLSEGVLKLADQKARNTYEKFSARVRQAHDETPQLKAPHAKADVRLPWDTDEGREENAPRQKQSLSAVQALTTSCGLRHARRHI